MKKEIREVRGLGCVFAFPEGFDGSVRHPLIILLHGAGSRGSNPEALARNPYFNCIEKHEDFPFISIAPQCSENTWYDHFETLKAPCRRGVRL